MIGVRDIEEITATARRYLPAVGHEVAAVQRFEPGLYTGELLRDVALDDRVGDPARERDAGQRRVAEPAVGNSAWSTQ